MIFKTFILCFIPTLCYIVYIFLSDLFNFSLKDIFYSIILNIKNISTNKNFVFVNEKCILKIFKTDKTKEEIQTELNELNIPNFDFNKYFIFVEKNKIKKLKQEKLLKKFERNIIKNNKLSFFERLKKEIKQIKKKNIEKNQNKMINDILLENDFDNSFNNNINLENSIKEIKN